MGGEIIIRVAVMKEVERRQVSVLVIKWRRGWADKNFKGIKVGGTGSGRQHRHLLSLQGSKRVL